MTLGGLDRPEWRAFLKRWLLVSAALHLLAAWFSIGIYDLDEHFQTLEFVAQRLGRADAAKMPWEFGLQQRPWIQPLAYTAIARAWIWAGIDNPRIWVATFRLSSAMLGWLATAGLALACHEWLRQDRWRKMAVKGLALLWFLPYFHARTSSESFSGSLFFMGLSLLILLRPSARALVATGFLWGLAGYARYQIAPMLLGVAAWCALVGPRIAARDETRRGRLSLRELSLVATGAIGAAAIGTALDRIGYGFWTAAPWNHLERNVLGGKAAQEFGAQPWWFYIWFIVEYLPPLTVPLGSAVILGWLAAPLHALTWVTLPMFAMLSFMVEHKELRFIFPATIAAPILAALAFERVSAWATGRFPRDVPGLSAFRAGGRALWTLLAIVNAGALAVSTLKPSSSQPLLYSHVYENWPRIRELHFVGADPYALGGANVQLYRHPGFRPVPQAGWDAIARLRGDFYVFHDHFELPPEAGALRAACALEFTVFPDWLRHFMFLPGIRDSASKWSVHRCWIQDLR